MVKLSVSKTELLGSNPSSPASFPPSLPQSGKKESKASTARESTDEKVLRLHHG